MPEADAEILALLIRIAEAVENRGMTPEALTAEQAGAMCGISRSKWHELDGRGLTPRRVEIGDRNPRWLKTEIIAWLRAGAPSRSTWSQLRESAMRKVA